MTEVPSPPKPVEGSHVSVGGPQYDLQLPSVVPQIILPKAQFRRLRERLLQGLSQGPDYILGAGFTLIGFGLASGAAEAIQWASLSESAQIFLTVAALSGIVIGVSFLGLSRKGKRSEVRHVQLVIQEMDDVAEDQGESRVFRT